MKKNENCNEMNFFFVSKKDFPDQLIKVKTMTMKMVEIKINRKTNVNNNQPILL